VAMKTSWAIAWFGLVAALCAEGALPLAVPLEGRIDAKCAPFDTLYVIPAGPVAGGFTTDSRVQVIDTIAGWARIGIEGWTPVSNLQQISGPIQSGSIALNEAGMTKQGTQCTAITKKGTRCKRTAKPGSTRCWQHPQ
jgi:hypothetical protein